MCHSTCSVQEIALGPGWWLTGRDKLCSVGTVLQNGVGRRLLTGINRYAAGPETGKFLRIAGVLLAEEAKCRP